MIFLLLAALGVIVAKKAATGGDTTAPPTNQPTPIIKDATGGALGGVLGNRGKPAEYYASGNPQYNNTTPPVVNHVPRPVTQLAKPQWTTNKMRVVQVAQVRGPSELHRIPPGPGRPVIAGFVNTRQASRSTTAPELAQPFWARQYPTS